MKFLALLFLVLVSAASPARAQLGWTREACAAKFGIHERPQGTLAIIPDSGLTFVKLEFQDGVCVAVSLSYEHLKTWRQVSEIEQDALLKLTAVGWTWKQTLADEWRKEWKTENGARVAVWDGKARSMCAMLREEYERRAAKKAP